MRWIAAILTVIISLLILMPCTDSEFHHDDAYSHIESVFDGSHTELCSPFCSDHDCHTHITLTWVNNRFVHLPWCDLPAVEQQPALPTPFFAIWQPPKIG